MSLKISIVTPTRNYLRFLPDAVESVLSQSYPNKELIVIDACSSDGTVEYLESQKREHPDNFRFLSEADRGQSDGINKGFQLASGEIIGWLNSDDRYLPGVFEIVAKFFEAHPEVDALYADFYFTDDSLNRIRPIYGNIPIRWLSLFYCYIASTTFFFRRRIIEEGNLLDTNYRISMDKEYFARLLHKGYRFHYMHQFFAEFRKHGGNISLPNFRRSPEMTKEALAILHTHLGLKLPWSPAERILYAFIHLLIKPLRLVIRGRERFQ